MDLKKFRSRLDNISQAELAERLGIPKTTLASYEQDRCDPNIKTLVKLADFFNVSIDELVGRETDTINLKYLDENESYLIRKILKMNQLELAKTKAYVMGLTED